MNLDKEKQYFGVSPVALTDNVVQSVTDYVADALDASEVLLKDQEGLSSKGKQIEEAIDKVFKLTEGAINTNFDKFELYVLNNLLKIPEDLHLPTVTPSSGAGDQEKADTPSRVSAKAEEKLDSEIEELKRRTLAVHFVNETIRQRNKTLEAELKLLEPLSEKLLAINKLAAAGQSKEERQDEEVAHANAALREALVQAAQLQDLLRKSTAQPA